jgi:transcriptional regulator with XRE-family HTH domain
MAAMKLFPMDDPEYARTYAEESALADASELIAEAMEHAGVSNADLARRLKVSRSEITARLRGDRNLTLRKLAATLYALGGRLELGLHLGAASVQKPKERSDVIQLSYERLRRKTPTRVLFGEHVDHHELAAEPKVDAFVRQMASGR